jgi:hypothetical protein
MSGPRPVVIKRSEHTVQDLEVNELLKPQFKGADVPKSELENASS